MKSLKDFNFKNKKVLVRCDFNIPLEKGKILDDFRIRQVLPTIKYLIRKKGKVILMSHLGRPEGKFIRELSLKPVAERLKELLKKKIIFLPDCQGEKTKKKIEKMEAGEVVLLENLRFYKEEEENDRNFTRALCDLGDVFVNEAFSMCHREHASIVGIPKYLPVVTGFLLEKEIKILSRVLEKPWRPLVVIIGGDKVSHKIKVVEKFLEKADHLLLGGKIANTILIHKGISLSLGKLSKEEKEIREKIKKIDLTNPKLHLPLDGIISLESLVENYLRKGAIGTVRKEEKIFDIGPETINFFSQIIKNAKMIFWAGPLGMFEEEKFEKGTKEIAQKIARNYAAFKIAGGGDTILALKKFNLINRFDHISTGGGAMLQFLADEKLPGIEALK